MLKLTKFTLNHLEKPVGISFNGMPLRFGWQLQSDARNVHQSSYRIRIAKKRDFTQLLLDTGVVDTAQSVEVEVPFDAQALHPYFARVQVTADNGESAESEVLRFVTAAECWIAPFVTAETEKRYCETSQGTLVRGEFTVREGLQEAFACTTALGLYNFYINGVKIGTDEMTPGWTDYRKRLLYQTYDVTKYLQSGANVSGAMLGAGWFKGVMGLARAHGNYGERTAFSMLLMLRYADGSTDTVMTGPDWLGADSPITFSEIYHGESYDASLEIEGWAESAGRHLDGRWRTVQIVPWNPETLIPQEGGTVTVGERFPARKLFLTLSGEQVVDFGQNMAGRIELSATGKQGDVLELRCFETLDAAGNAYTENLRHARATMQYRFGADGTITWHPRFTYMGFRYALILRWDAEAPSCKNFTACSLYSCMESAGKWESSNPLLNQLHHNITWGLKSNFLDVPTDCPQRDERLGWTGDAQIFCRTACYLMDTDVFYRKWLADLAADQMPDGGVPHVIPNCEEGKEDKNWLLSNSPYGASAWGDAAVIVPWTVYEMYGDTQLLARQYDSMKRWIEFMRSHSVDDVWGFKMQLGDWVALDAEPGSYFGATPTELTCAAYYAYSTGLFAKAAQVLGREQDVVEYGALYKRLVKKYQSTYFTASGNMAVQTQTAHIVSLWFDLVPEQLREQTLQSLRRLLAEQNGHLVTGFIGTPYFCFALSENGGTKDAYDLLLKEDYPSWLYQVKMGATTVWEHWDGIKPDGSMWSAGMNSFNHYAYGAVGEWLYRVVAGINCSRPGFSKVLLAPRPSNRLDWVSATHKTPFGPVTSAWKIQSGAIEYRFAVPANATATVRLYDAKTVLQSDGLQFVETEIGFEAEAGSGSYCVMYTTE